MTASLTRRIVGLAAATIAAFAAFTAVAGAAATSYAPDPESRNFNGGDGGWTSSTTHSGPCVELVTCYAVDYSHQSSGGPDGDGDGFIRGELTSVFGAGISTDAIWTSPEFVYHGVGGRPARNLRMTLDRRTDLSAILPVIADNATYAVQAVPVGGGDPVPLQELTSMEGAEDGWTREASQVAPNALEVGQAYQLQLISRFNQGLTVIDTGLFDYDNVILRARRTIRPAVLRRGAKKAIGAAVTDGKRLAVRVGCPPAVRPGKCTLRTTALLKRKGPRATTTRKVGARGGVRKFTTVRVKPKHRTKVAARKRIWVKVNVRADGRKAVVRKQVRLRRA